MKNVIVNTLFLILLVYFVSTCSKKNPECVSNYNAAKGFMIKKDYKDAKKSFIEIDSTCLKYDSVLIFLKKIDTLIQNEKISLKIEETRKNIDSCVFELDNFNGSDYRGSLASLKEEVNYFSYVVSLIHASEKDTIEKIKEMGKTIEKKLIKIQLSEFPILRKEYAKIMNRKLWRDNIEVMSKGNRNSTIQFIGSTFASHSNISDFHLKMGAMVYFFRYKRENYLWTEYDDEYPYYPISSVSDDVLHLDFSSPNSDD